MQYLLMILLYSTLISACSKPALDFYMLSTDSDNPPINQTFNKSTNIGLGPIHLPDYLNRPQLVIETAENQYHLEENQRWAENLEQNISRELTQFLVKRLGIEQIWHYPWSHRQVIDYQVSLDILQLHHGVDGFNHFQALWRIKRQDQTLFAKRFDCKVASVAQASAMVKAQSQCLTQLGTDIEASLRELGNAN